MIIFNPYKCIREKLKFIFCFLTIFIIVCIYGFYFLLVKIPSYNNPTYDTSCFNESEGNYFKDSNIEQRHYGIIYNRTDKDLLDINAGHCFRNINNEIRCLPSFIIVGAMKCGTGELMKWLNLHPLLKYEAADCKWCEYIKKFPAIRHITEENRIKLMTFDKSPDYMRSEKKLKQIKELLPDVKLIVLLRDPTIRAYSAFLHNCRHHRFQATSPLTSHQAPIQNNSNSSGDSSPVKVTSGYECNAVGFHKYLFMSSPTSTSSDVAINANSTVHGVYASSTSRSIRVSQEDSTALRSDLPEIRFGIYHTQLLWILK